MTSNEHKPGSASELIEDCIAEAELERIEKLSPEELEAEMRASGLDPKRADAIFRAALAAADAREEAPREPEARGGTDER
jgi:hypothetical protein